MKTFLVIILGLVYAASGQAACPGLYTAVGNGCYLFPATQVTWLNANMFCQFSGGYLANIDSAAEQSALKLYHDEHFSPISWRWLGASDGLSDQAWRWVPTGATVIYTDWLPGQPATGDTLNCLSWETALDSWYTSDCCDTLGYPLCEAQPI